MRLNQDNHQTVRALLYLVNEFLLHRADTPYRKFTFVYDRRGAQLENSDVWLLKKMLKIVQGVQFPPAVGRSKKLLQTVHGIRWRHLLLETYFL